MEGSLKYLVAKVALFVVKCNSTSPLMFGNISWESAYYYIMLLVMGSQDTEIIMCMYGGFGLTITAFLSTRSSNSCVPCEPVLSTEGLSLVNCAVISLLVSTVVIYLYASY